MPGALTTKSQPEGQGYVKLLLASVGWNLQCMAFNECVSWLQLVDGRTPCLYWDIIMEMWEGQKIQPL